MNLISRLLPPPNVIVDLDVSSKKRVFEQVGLLFHIFQRGIEYAGNSRKCSYVLAI